MILHTTTNVPYLPLPNTVDVVADLEVAPLSLTKTAFMIGLLPDGSVVMANNRRRGLEYPGGHIDPGESACAAAVREFREETGYYVSHIRAIGRLLMTSGGVVPDDWKYPHPIGFQQFFVGDVMGFDPYVENDECLAPVIISPSEALRTFSPSRIALLSLAHRVLRGNR